ncbi:amidohydrolase family protein [Amycolatopsis sp. WQ 127309]|uniref:amidohydrolase family protein n=1 Tax=Amycolatopsis sp. WQ 127309 TaxID=2932773 RepID=UPI001FF6139C|nr:amidohydrolase family protein [Amycolatopsis sp. WQ 127309]UOZ05353.1 amidohydrolase [Amycolatopsis sp. WQ 127309]
MTGRIDVHQHLLPPRYLKALEDNGETAGGWPMPSWSPGAATAMMDGAGIATGLLSISAPGVHFGDDAAARDLAREVNDFQAELVKDAPGRFGHFAVLPLPDFDGAVAEAVRALDELHADGVVLLSNARGRYLGDPAYGPLWTELAARRAVVFVHPAEPPIARLDGLPSPLLDFPFDTTRAALDLVAHGVFDRHPDLRVILSHAGGFLPFAAHRFTGAAMFNPGTTPDGILAGLRKFYFDTALSATPTALPSLYAFAEPGHVLYGSDFPFAPKEWREGFDRNLTTYEGPGAEHFPDVDRTAAEVLFPRLATGS